MPVSRQDPHLDPSLLERVDRFGHAVLQLVLDRSRAEEEQIAFNDLGGLVERVLAPVDRRRRSRVHDRPLLVLVFRNVAHGDAKCAQTLGSVLLSSVVPPSRVSGRAGALDVSGTHLEMVRSRLGKRLTFARQALKDDRIGTLAVQLDLAFRRPDDRRHAFPRRVELEDVQDLVLALLAVDADKDGLRFPGLNAGVSALLALAPWSPERDGLPRLTTKV